MRSPFVLVSLTLSAALGVAQAAADVQGLLGAERRVRDSASFVTERGEAATLVLFVTDAIDPPVDAMLPELASCPEMVTGIALTGTYHLGLVIDGGLVNEVEIPRIREPPDEPASANRFPLRNTREWNHCFWGGEPTESREIEPTKLIRLADFNGDGRAWEFRLVQPAVCGHVMTLLAGYSGRQRKAIVYPIIERERRFSWEMDLFPSPMRADAREVRLRWRCGDHGVEIEVRRRFEYRPEQEAWVMTAYREKDCGYWR